MNEHRSSSTCASEWSEEARATFEDTYPRHPFADLVRLGIGFARAIKNGLQHVNGTCELGEAEASVPSDGRAPKEERNPAHHVTRFSLEETEAQLIDCGRPS